MRSYRLVIVKLVTGLDDDACKREFAQILLRLKILIVNGGDLCDAVGEACKLRDLRFALGVSLGAFGLGANRGDESQRHNEGHYERQKSFAVFHGVYLL